MMDRADKTKLGERGVMPLLSCLRFEQRADGELEHDADADWSILEPRHKSWVSRRIGLIERLHPELVEQIRDRILPPEKQPPPRFGFALRANLTPWGDFLKRLQNRLKLRARMPQNQRTGGRPYRTPGDLLGNWGRGEAG